MVKYKLKKWYPSLPKNWEIGMEVGGEKFFANIEQKYTPYVFFDPSEITNNPEFWEKVEQKDYEILDKEYVPGHRIAGSSDNPNMWRIKSIKRLSDGEIFSVGDKIDFEGLTKQVSKISLDEYDVNKTHKRTTPYLECGSGFGVTLGIAKKAKQPLFLTEDGVEVFEGDRVFLIKQYQNTSIAWLVVFPSWSSKFGDKGKVIDTDLAFHSEELARKWIDENKPKYNKNQIIKFISDAHNELDDDYIMGGKIFDSRVLVKLLNKILDDKT